MADHEPGEDSAGDPGQDIDHDVGDHGGSRPLDVADPGLEEEIGDLLDDDEDPEDPGGTPGAEPPLAPGKDEGADDEMKHDIDIDAQDASARQPIEPHAQSARDVEKGFDRDLASGRGWSRRVPAAILAGLALVLLATIPPAARPAMLPVIAAAAAGLIFLIVREPAPALLATVPFVALANLEAWIEPGAAYPSEAILLAAAAVTALRRPGAFRFSGAARLALAYGAWMAIAALAAGRFIPEPVATADWTRLLRTGFLAAILTALGSNLAASGDGARLWSRASLLAAGCLGAIALGEAALRAGGGVPAVGSWVGGSELLALHLSLLIPPGLVLAARGEGGRPRLVLLFSALAAGALVISFSRSGWIGTWAGILGMGWVSIKADRRLARRFLLLAGGLLFLGLFVALAGAFLTPDGGEFARAYAGRLGSLARGDLFADRAADWRKGVDAVRTHPWFGHPAAPNPYNLALALAAASGLPALFLFAGLTVAAIRNGLRVAAAGGIALPLAVGLLGAVFATLTTGIGESTLGARLTPPAFATLGLLVGIGTAPRAGSRR